MLDYAVQIVRQTKDGQRPGQGNRADEILKAVNLNGLSKVFYAGPDGLKLVITEGSKTIIDTKAEIAAK